VWTPLILNALQWSAGFSPGGKAVEQVAQRSRGWPIIGSVQGQVGWGFSSRHSALILEARGG